MKWLLSTVVTLLLISTLSNAQNKTFSIGTPTANPNAALQVESPGNNQGILIPRLTTVQRTSLSAALTTTDVGLIVFDTDSRALAIWNGTTWDLGSKVGAPITIDNAAGTGGAANLVNSNAANADAALVVNTTGSGNAIETTGKIQAGQFIGDGAALTNVNATGIQDNLITNADINSAASINGSKIIPNFGAQNVTTSGAISAGVFNGDGSGLTNLPPIGFPFLLNNTSAPTGSTLFELNSNPANSGDIVGVAKFSNLNASATSNVLSVNNAGSGATLVVNATGTGSGGLFSLGASTTLPALRGLTSGTGSAGFFLVSNPSNTTAALVGQTNGAGVASQGYTTGTGTAGRFEINNLTNASSSLMALTNGTGNVANFQTNNTTSFAPTLYSETNGLNESGAFVVNNGSNTAAALRGATNGAGPGVMGFSTGTGSAANFQIVNTGNSAPVINISSDGTGNAINANRPIQATDFIATGNVNINGLTYTWPGAQSGGVLTNNGSGTLSWTSVAGTGDMIGTNNLSDLQDIAVARTNLGLGTLATLGSVTSGEITDGTIENKDISALATIAGTKIDPNFGVSNIFTTGSVTATSFIGDGSGLTGLSSSGWGLNGNGSTTAGTNFIGTTDTQDLAFKTNNAEQMRIYTSGQVGIGTTPIAAKFDVGVSSTQTIGIHAGISSPSAVQNRGIQADASGSTAQNIGVYGTGFIDGSNGAIGVYGEAIGNGASDAFGLYGVTNNFTSTTGKTYGIFASAEGGSTNWAGYFYSGNVHIKNGLSVGSTDGTFGNIGEVLTSQGVGVAPIWAPAGGFSLPYSGSTGSSANTLDLTNSGSGNTVKAVTTGTGAAGYFENTNTANGMRTLVGITNSDTGGAGGFLIANPTNSNTALTADTNGNGLAFGATTTGTSTAGQFDINNASNSSAAIKAQTNGTGVAVKATNTGTGMAGDFTSSNSSQTLYVLNTGSGRAGQFTGSGSGNATLQAQNNGAGGSALALFQTNVGYALDIQQGGVKLSNQSVVAPATITTKAALYEVTGSGNINLPSGTVGETCWVANSSGGSITVNAGPTVLDGTIRQFIRLTGGWQVVN